jgi:methionyl-tRNA formyltransferase
MTSAVVFAYHDVGVRCLSVLLAHGVTVLQVYTHPDDPNENIWFGSVAELSHLHGIPVTLVGSADHPGLAESVTALRPDFVFSFYYRFMLPPALLAGARRGAFNMHGSLLPQYRGRAPVNWAIIHDEHVTGATLHEMVTKPDAGRVVDQLAVPILPNDIAVDVFRKVTVAAETVLYRSLPQLMDGTAVLTPQNLAAGRYYGGRKPEDGRIDWTWDTVQVHNLVRAVAPPYPGAYAMIGKQRLRLLRTMRIDHEAAGAGAAVLFASGDGLYLRCADGGTLKVLAAEINGQALNAQNIHSLLGSSRIVLTN